MVNLRIDDPISIDVRGTALDVLANTEYLVVGGSNTITLLTVSSASVNTWIKLRSNRSLVRLLKFNPLSTGHFASVSGQFLDVFSLGNSSQIQYVASFTAQSRKISDFCWCPFDDQLMITCAENDSVNFWDLRTDLRKPTAQLGVTFGASQSKFAPHLNNYLLTTHGTDVRLWDLRHASQPVVQFTAHQSRVLCLDWHPHHREPNSFFTSANDCSLKLWNMKDQKSTPEMVSVAPFSAWRLVFSYEGEELAALGMPPANSLALYSNYGLENPRLVKGIEREILMDAAWHKSTTALKSTTKFLYTLSAVKQKLRRHPIAYEFSNELRDEMATPITQSKTDEERDRLVAAADQAVVDPELMQMAGGSLDEIEDAMDQLPKTPTTATRTRISTTSETAAAAMTTPRKTMDSGRHSISSRTMLFGSVKNTPSTSMPMNDSGGGMTPQWPNYSEWQRWVRAPNVAGGDLLTELEALRKHTTEGLYTTEVNFTRAAIGFSYMHLNKYPKINFEMRFHREFIDNGLVFVEVLQKDSPFNADKASLFLTMLQQESDEQLKVQSDRTILCRVCQQLPRIIEMMKVFTQTMDIPADGNQPSKPNSQSGSASEEQFMLATTVDAIGPETSTAATTANRSISAAIPCSYTPSLYDHRVPAPRNCGARFNRSGYLVAFGPINTIFPSTQDDNELAEGIPRIVPPIKGTRSGAAGATSARHGSTRSQPSEGKVHPRSLAEYCVFVNPTPSSAVSIRQTSTSQFQCSPPVRGISPGTSSGGADLRPTSPCWRKPSESMTIHHPNTQEISSSSSTRQQQNSLSPPSLLRQSPFNAELDESEGQISGIISHSRPIAMRVLGSSPNSSSSSAVRSFSLQNVAQSIRHRGSSMSGGINSIIGPTTSANEPSMAAATTSMATASNIGLLNQQQSVIEHGSTTGPAAVMPEQIFNSIVVIYDATTLLPISQSLAKSYKLLGTSTLDICNHNYQQAAKQGRKDLLTMWELVKRCVQTPLENKENAVNGLDNGRNAKITQFARLFRLDESKIPRALETFTAMETPWAVHPVGRELVNRLLDHYASKFDLQTAAIITCIFTHKSANSKTTDKGPTMRRDPFSVGEERMPQGGVNPASLSAAGSQMTSLDARIPLPLLNLGGGPSRKTSAALANTISSGDGPSTSSNIWNRSSGGDNFNSSRTKRSMNQLQLSPAPEQFLSPSSSPSPKTTTYPLPQRNADNELLLDPALSSRFEEIRRRYADILYRWRMYKNCAEVLKYCNKNDPADAAIGTIKAVRWCSFCGSQQREDGNISSSRCAKCKRPSTIYCAICEKPCQGVVATCTSCSHGGHLLHIERWFNVQSHCPLGCGCECKF